MSCGKVRKSNLRVKDHNEQKRIQFSKPSVVVGENRKAFHKKLRRNEYINKNERLNASVGRDSMQPNLKDKEKAHHQTTKEEVKTLRTKLGCLNKDYNELQNQFDDMEEAMVKLKKEKDKEIEYLRLRLAAKKEAELVTSKAAPSTSPSIIIKTKDQTSNTEPATSEVAVQTIGNISCYQLEEKNAERLLTTVAETEDMCKTGKIELVEEVSMMVEAVLVENTNVMQVNADLISNNTELKEKNAFLESKLKEKKNAQKIFLRNVDNLKDEQRELRTKVFRLTIENMKLKRENHVAKFQT